MTRQLHQGAHLLLRGKWKMENVISKKSLKKNEVVNFLWCSDTINTTVDPPLPSNTTKNAIVK